MSTRCMIGRLNKDGTVSAVYCHYDGYPYAADLEDEDKGVGDTLLKHYGPKELNELFERGAMRTLGPTPDECDFYEDDLSAEVFPSLKDYYNDTGDREYHYYLDLNNVWHVVVIGPKYPITSKNDFILIDYINKIKKAK